MAIAPVLKTGVRKDIRVRIPGPPLDDMRPRRRSALIGAAVFSIGLVRRAARALSADLRVRLA